MDAPKKKLRVLWLDDVHSMCELYRDILTIEGLLAELDVQFVEDGDAAMHRLASNPPDIFITDLHHPGVHLDIQLERLEAAKVTYPILILTAANIQVIQQFTDARCPHLNVRLLQKPFDVNELRAALKEIIQAAKN